MLVHPARLRDRIVGITQRKSSSLIVFTVQSEKSRPKTLGNCFAILSISSTSMEHSSPTVRLRRASFKLSLEPFAIPTLTTTTNESFIESRNFFEEQRSVSLSSRLRKARIFERSWFDSVGNVGDGAVFFSFGAILLLPARLLEFVNSREEDILLSAGAGTSAVDFDFGP